MAATPKPVRKVIKQKQQKMKKQLAGPGFEHVKKDAAKRIVKEAGGRVKASHQAGRKVAKGKAPNAGRYHRSDMD